MAGTKNLKRNASRVESDDEDTILSTKKTKTVNALANGTDKDGNPYWEVSWQLLHSRDRPINKHTNSLPTNGVWACPSSTA